ncbi:MAG: NAD(P)/FAD-dependent oxidoreductase [Myxococcota bacterium]
MTGDPDAVVIGAGPNGLVAAATLARAGWSVLVLEANREPGGACRSRALTRPGFVHDLGAAFFPFAEASPALAELALEEVGLVWKRAEVESAHPAPDGTCASITRDLARADRAFGGLAEDGRDWRQTIEWFASCRDDILDMLLSELPPLRSALRVGPINLLRFAEIGLSSGRGYGVRHFRSEAARRVLAGLSLHTDIGPDDPLGAAVGFMLGGLAATSGFAVPEGGTSSITRALVARLEQAGGALRTHCRVTNLVVREGRVAAVRTSAGDEVVARRAVIADVAAATLYLKLLDEAEVPSRVRASMRRFPYGFGTFKVDWALDGPVPWEHPDAAAAAVVHTGDSLNDLQRFTDDVRRGRLAEHPYIVLGQQSLPDPTRAPPGQHTLWSYSRVPPQVEGGWRNAAERYADQFETRIEAMAPGFRSRILERAIATPIDLEATNENLIGGDLGGGSAQVSNLLFFRPLFPYFRYRTPVAGLYLGSSYTHPGAGVHGMCGYNAAHAALRDLG